MFIGRKGIIMTIEGKYLQEAAQHHERIVLVGLGGVGYAVFYTIQLWTEIIYDI
jgi:hypothetical protein